MTGSRGPARRAGTPTSHVQRPATLRPGARPGGGARRGRPIRRASAGPNPTRAGALLVLLVAIAGLYGAVSSDAFAARRTEITGGLWTPDEAILAALALPERQNVFTLRTTELQDRLEGLPTVLGADVSVALPDTIRVEVLEREALLVWRVGAHRYAVDGTGRLFAEVTADAPQRAASLPVVDDRRAESSTLAVGSVLDAVSLDASLRIGSLTPADVGSAASRLAFAVDDESGYTVTGLPIGWTAVFGFYTPTLRPTTLVPGQVRLLRSLILGRESVALRVILADDRSGTFLPRPTPTPAPTAKP